MNVPVQPRSPWQRWVDAREKIGGEDRGEDGADELVGASRQEEFVDVKRQSR